MERPRGYSLPMDRKTWALAAAVVVAARAASWAQKADFQSRLRNEGASMGVIVDDSVFVPVPGLDTDKITAQDSLEVIDEVLNFDYQEMDTHLESFRKVIYAKRRKKGSKKKVTVPVVVKTGARDMDRVKNKQITHIVIHSSLGSYSGSIGHLVNNSGAAAHFMVGADGRVATMVDIDDYANHVKNDEEYANRFDLPYQNMNLHSVGIETETGQLDKNRPFLESDWEPRSRWRMYSALAWLIRGIHYETGGARGGVPRDRAHIIDHSEADAGIPGAHKDPGHYYNGWEYEGLTQHFGQKVTPREFLLKLVNDDSAPTIVPVAEVTPNGTMLARIEASDREKYGMTRLRAWKNNSANPEIKLDACKKANQCVMVAEWKAPVYGIPPVKASLPYPTAAGDYFVEAEDLVLNRTEARLKVEPAAIQAPGIANVSVRTTYQDFGGAGGGGSVGFDAAFAP